MRFREIFLSGRGAILCLFLGTSVFLGCATAPPSSTPTANSLPSKAAVAPILTPEKNQLMFSDETLREKAVPKEETEVPPRISATLTPGAGREQTASPKKPETAKKFCPAGKEKQEQAQKPLFDIPIVMNPLVENFIHYYQTTGRKQFSIWLARSERYIPMMRKVLKEHGLPTDLVYLAMIESGFNPRAYSNRRASGPWQFIPGTGRKYGLRVNYWIDERRDPEKSTIAAARYLKDLYDQFESWHLAAAAYNCGEGKLSRAIKRYKTEDYWQLIRHHYLKRETRMYVPQMIAAALIAKEPEKYGFTNIQYQEPLKYEEAKVPGGVPLRDIAKACHCNAQTLQMLNPELIRRCTPPYVKHFEIKIPKGTKQILAMNVGRLRPIVKATSHGWVQTHVVRRGDTLYELSLKYHVRVSDLRYLNHIRGNLLHIGQRLLIPAGRLRHRPHRMYAQRDSRHAKNQKRRSAKYAGHRPRHKRYREIVYVVRKGDNLWSIARSFNIHVRDICRLNPHVNPSTLLRPRDKLKLRVPMAKLSGLPRFISPSVQ